MTYAMEKSCVQSNISWEPTSLGTVTNFLFHHSLYHVVDGQFRNDQQGLTEKKKMKSFCSERFYVWNSVMYHSNVLPTGKCEPVGVKTLLTYHDFHINIGQNQVLHYLLLFQNHFCQHSKNWLDPVYDSEHLRTVK